MRKYLHILIAIYALSLLVSVGGGSTVALAQSSGSRSQAGLVLQFPDGSTQTFCIPFAGDSVSGIDLLVKSGLDLKVQAYGGLGAEVCEIGSAGCDYPNQACACQSYGPGGVYWSYFHLTNGRWQTSVTGAGSYQVHDGDVEGWAFSAGKPPAVYTFSQLCPAASPQPNPTKTPISIPTVPPTRAILPTRTTIPPTHKPLPTATTRHATPTSKPAPPSAAPPEAPTQQPTPAPTITPQPTISPTLMLAATSTSTSQPTTTSTTTPTSQPAQTTPTSTPTPTIRNPQSAIRNPEDVARNVGIAIGAVVLGSLAVWGIIGIVQRGRKGGGGDVE